MKTETIEEFLSRGGRIKQGPKMKYFATSWRSTAFDIGFRGLEAGEKNRKNRRNQMKHKGMDIFGEEDMLKEAPSGADDQVSGPGEKNLKAPAAVSGVSDKGNEARLDHLPLKQSGKME